VEREAHGEHVPVPPSAEEKPLMDAISVSGALPDSAPYLTWGWLSISVPNLIVILVMIALFVLAILLPFPKDRDRP
jgi:hypothetical protein